MMPAVVIIKIYLVLPRGFHCRDQIKHLIGTHNAMAFSIAGDGDIPPNLGDNTVDLRPGHSTTHANVLQDMLYAFGGHCHERRGWGRGLNNENDFLMTHGYLDDFLAKSLRVFLREVFDAIFLKYVIQLTRRLSAGH